MTDKAVGRNGYRRKRINSTCHRCFRRYERLFSRPGILSLFAFALNLETGDRQ